jgi:FMN phosphatase YigB (HAD superfamily)
VHALGRIRDAGYWVGVAANQPPEAEDFLRRLFPWDFIGISSLWGVEKPDPAFFARIVESLPYRPGEIAYVGDRVDNDVVPALTAGLVAVHVKRGPWGRAHDAPPEAIVVESLHELPEAVVG